MRVKIREEYVCRENLFISFYQFEHLYSSHCVGCSPYSLTIEIASRQEVACVLLACPKTRRGAVTRSLERCCHRYRWTFAPQFLAAHL